MCFIHFATLCLTIVYKYRFHMKLHSHQNCANISAVTTVLLRSIMYIIHDGCTICGMHNSDIIYSMSLKPDDLWIMYTEASSHS